MLRQPRWARQPIVPVRINRANPITDRLVYLMNPAVSLYDLCFQEQTPTNFIGTPLRKPVINSPLAPFALSLDGSSYFQVTRRPGYIATTSAAHTMLAMFRITAVGTPQTLINFGEVTDSSFSSSLIVYSTGVLAHGVDFSNSQALSTLAVSANAVHVGAVSVSAANARTFMLDGFIATNTTSIAGGASTGGISVGTCFQNLAVEAAGSKLTGDIFLLAVWNRTLRAVELQALGKNPWQLFSMPGMRFLKAGGAAAYNLALDPGSYALTGAVAQLRSTRIISLGTGAYLMVGQAAGLARGLKINAAAGSYALTGAAMTFFRTYKLNLAAGAYAVTGAALQIRAQRSLNLAPGAYALTGAPATIGSNRFMNLAAGSYAVTGAALTLRADRSMTLGPGSYSLTGADAGLVYDTGGATPPSPAPYDGPYLLDTLGKLMS